MLKKIIWNNDYCIGIPEIDSQHCKIIDQINYLIDNHNCKAKASLNQGIILFLDKYTDEHFSTEEEYLNKINYPDLDNHIKLHQSFKLKTVKSAVKVMKGQEDVSEETITFLKFWWTDHILKADMEFKNFISKR
jgi:hemerythrin